MASPMDMKYLNKQSPSERFSPPKRLFLDDTLKPENDEVSELRRRISRMELEQADRAHEYNEQSSDLQSHVTRLRASVEKGEVLRQKLEYELTLAQKATNQEKRKFAEKESSLQRSAASLKDKAGKLEIEVEKVNKELKTERAEWEEERRTWKDLIATRDREISQLKDANQSLAEGQRRIETVKVEQESNIKELQEKCSILENQRNSQNDTVRRMMKDVEFSTEREERTKNELTALQNKLKASEESVEAERAAHLETKFSSEILQLRVRDLEGAMEVEKASLTECRKKLENVTRDHKDTEVAFEDQRDAHAELKSLMAKKDEQFSLEINELTRELNEKINQERRLSDQLEIHQKNFDSLKNELAEAKKQQTDMQSMYGDSMTELELLLDNFQISQSEEAKSKKKSPRSKKLTPSIVLENLRYTLRDYQTRLKNSTAELERLKKTVDEISSECNTYKEMSWTRDKALQEAQRLMKNSHKESAKYKADCVKYENDLLQKDSEGDKLAKRFADQKDRYQRLRNEYDKQKSNWEKNQEEHQLFLHTIYQQLVNGRVFMRSPKNKTQTAFSTAELTGMIKEQLQSNTNALSAANKKVEELENSLTIRDEALDKLQEMYDETVKKVAKKTKDREHTWKRQKVELEKHYKKILEDLQSQSEKSQVTLDDVWAKMSEINQIKEELETKNSKLRSSLHKAQNENRCLLAATALLSGGLWSAFRKVENLIIEKATLMRTVQKMNQLKDKTADLVSVLQLEMEENVGNSRHQSQTVGKRLLPILRFRKAVVAVLAVNRFQQNLLSSSRLFTCKEWPTRAKRNAAIIYGGSSKNSRNVRGIAKTSSKTVARNFKEGISWLSSPKLSTTIYHSMNKLVDKLGKYTKLATREDAEYTESRSEDEVDIVSKHSPSSAEIITSAARSSYGKMIQGLSSEFPSLTDDSPNCSPGFCDSLIDHLRIGLKKILIDNRESSPENVYMSTTTIVNRMNHHFLSFTQRLHAAELERRALRQDVARLREEREDMDNLLKSERSAKHKLESGDRALSKKLRELEEHLEDTVQVDKYQTVCSDLRMALEREEQAQGLLEEQTKQMEEMGKRMELHSFKGEAKDATLTETLKALTSCKNELRIRDESVKKIQREITMLDNEKLVLHQNLKDMQNTMRSISRERELLTAYVRSAGTVLKQSNYQAMLSSSDQFDFVLPELVLPSEVLAMDGHSTSQDIRICQDIVGLFLQAQRQALNQIVKLNAEKQQLSKRLEFLTHEVQVNKEHVLQMKDDLRATCQRSEIHGLNLPRLDLDGVLNTMSTKEIPAYSTADSSPRHGFVALMAQSDSFSASKGISGSLANAK